MASCAQGSHGCDFRYIIYNASDVVARTTRSTTTATRRFNHSPLTPNIFFSPSLFMPIHLCIAGSTFIVLFAAVELIAVGTFSLYILQYTYIYIYKHTLTNIRYKLSLRSGNVHYII